MAASANGDGNSSVLQLHPHPPLSSSPLQGTSQADSAAVKAADLKQAALAATLKQAALAAALQDSSAEIEAGGSDAARDPADNSKAAGEQTRVVAQTETESLATAGASTNASTVTGPKDPTALANTKVPPSPDAVPRVEQASHSVAAFGAGSDRAVTAST